MLSQNFFESLLFFDKDCVSCGKLNRLKKTLEKCKTMPSVVGHASRAVVPILLWLVALLDYHKMREDMKPNQLKLELAEKALVQVRSLCVLGSCLYSND